MYKVECNVRTASSHVFLPYCLSYNTIVQYTVQPNLISLPPEIIGETMYQCHRENPSRLETKYSKFSSNVHFFHRHQQQWCKPLFLQYNQLSLFSSFLMALLPSLHLIKLNSSFKLLPLTPSWMISALF